MKAVLSLFVVFFVQASFAGYCGPIDPYAAQIDHQICNMQTTRENCGGSCTWYRDDGLRRPFCMTADPYDTILAPICNGYKTRETCNNNRTICVWGR